MVHPQVTAVAAKQPPR